MPFLQVLAEAGPDGLALGEVVRRINAAGLRDLRSSRNPDASVGGALARDIIFWKVSPARFALHAVVAHHRFVLPHIATSQSFSGNDIVHNWIAM